MARRNWGPPAFQDDDKGTFLVFEAVLVAIFIFTSVLFVTSIQHPTQDLERGDVNLGLVAADTLQVLQNREPLDNTTYSNRLEEIVSLSMAGNHTGGHDLIRSVLPPQSRYVLRLNNGVEPLHLLPPETGLAVQPRGARGSESFIMPNWTINEINVTTTPEIVYPGQWVTEGSHPIVYAWTSTTSAQPKCLLAPDGSRDSPLAGTSWRNYWQGTPGLVPLDIPYGAWLGFHNQVKCTGGDDEQVRVLLPPGDVNTTRPVYGVQLVIWRAA